MTGPGKSTQPPTVQVDMNRLKSEPCLRASLNHIVVEGAEPPMPEAVVKGVIADVKKACGVTPDEILQDYRQRQAALRPKV